MSGVLISQLVYAELVSPNPQETVDWMVGVLGLEETTCDGHSVYLRGWAEWLHSSLIVTEGPEPALGRVGWRAHGPGDPEKIAKIAKVAEDAGVAVGWTGERPGRGAAFQYRTPYGGHLMEAFWEAELYQAPPEKAETELQSGRRGTRAVKRLGHRQTATISPEPGFKVFSTTTCNAGRSTHDYACVPENSGATGRVNHIAYRVDQRLDVERAAEVFMANGNKLEFGPGIHGMHEITYLYVREPGGRARIEINSGGWENYLPDWECRDWLPHQGANVMWRNQPFVASMMESFPPLSEEQQRQEEAAVQASGITAQTVKV